MEKCKATAKIWLDSRKPLKTGKYSVKMEIYYARKTMRYDTGITVTKDEWEKMNGQNLRIPQLQKDLKTLNLLKSKAHQVIDELGDDFNFDKFALQYCGKTPKNVIDKQDVYQAFDAYIITLANEKRIGTKEAYITTSKSLKQYAPILCFKDVTVKFLERYQQQMIENGRSLTTVGIYLRNLRAIMNQAKEDKIITPDQYPFGSKLKHKYEIPVGSNIKKALEKEDLSKIMNCVPVSEYDAWSVDMWLFSFYCNGMNMADIFNLKYENIIGEYLYFYREKTKRAKKAPEPVDLYITEPIRRIIDKWGNQDKVGKNYIFNVYQKGMTAEEIYWVKRNAIRRINEAMKRLRTRAGINQKVTTYVSRHTWATYLMNNDASLAYISKGLGHTSLKTTENYLANFTDDKKVKMGNLIKDLQKELTGKKPQKRKSRAIESSRL